jgi:hypothetical protein
LARGGRVVMLFFVTASCAIQRTTVPFLADDRRVVAGFCDH